MYKQVLISRIAGLINARQNCKESNNDEWYEKHTEALHDIESDLLPHGSGIDSGCTIDLEKSTDSRIVINVPFHTMDPNGFYAGWRDYTVIVTPSLISRFNLRITGRDYNNLKEHLYQVFEYELSQEIAVGVE